MKQTKLFGLLMVAAMAIGLNTSCSKDEDTTPELVEGTGTDFKVVRDKDNNTVQLDKFSWGNDTYEYYYNASGKLNKMIMKTGSQTYKPTVINKGFEVLYNETTGDGITTNWKTEVKLDNNDNITSYHAEENQKRKTDSYKLEEDVTFKYDHSQIKNVEIKGKEVENINGAPSTVNYKITITFTWKNGNIDEGEVLALVDDKEERGTIAFSYNTYTELKSNQMPFNLVVYGILGGFAQSSQFKYLIPLIGFGNATKNAPSYVNGQSMYISTNSDGTISSEGNCSYTYKK